MTQIDVVMSLWAQQLVLSGEQKATRSKYYIEAIIQHLDAVRTPNITAHLGDSIAD